MNLKTSGEILFRLYSTAVNGKAAVGDDLVWDKLSDRQKQGWHVAARLHHQELLRLDRGGPGADLVAKMKVLVQNQADLNSKAYSSDWLEKGASREWMYPVAASQEISEFLNSYWQPWWSKENVRDLANCRIEIVDALHFLMSELLIAFGGDVDASAFHMAVAYEVATETDGVLGVEETVRAARSLQVMLNSHESGDDVNMLGLEQLFQLSASIEFDLSALSALYMGKSVLNQFRKDNGYKLGTYKKKWDGVHEDNYFLSVWIDEKYNADTVDGLTNEQIYNWLTVRYAAFTRPTGTADSDAATSRLASFQK